MFTNCLGIPTVSCQWSMLAEISTLGESVIDLYSVFPLDRMSLTGCQTTINLVGRDSHSLDVIVEETSGSVLVSTSIGDSLPLLPHAPCMSWWQLQFLRSQFQTLSSWTLACWWHGATFRFGWNPSARSVAWLDRWAEKWKWRQRCTGRTPWQSAVLSASQSWWWGLGMRCHKHLSRSVVT